MVRSSRPIDSSMYSMHGTKGVTTSSPKHSPKNKSAIGVSAALTSAPYLTRALPAPFLNGPDSRDGHRRRSHRHAAGTPD